MPVYVYRREDGSTFEIVQRMAADALVRCPASGQRVERVLQPFTPHYRGGGFYSTDHRQADTEAVPASGMASSDRAPVPHAEVDAKVPDH